jgi:hypothetical protein
MTFMYQCSLCTVHALFPLKEKMIYASNVTLCTRMFVLGVLVGKSHARRVICAQGGRTPVSQSAVMAASIGSLSCVTAIRRR